MRWFRTIRAFRSWVLSAPRPVWGAVLGLLCALLVQAGLGLHWLDGFERGTLDTLFQARRARNGDQRIILVIVNDQTIARYNAWPLPRRVYADLVQHLHRAGAKTIAFDLLFAEKSASHSGDAAFMKACSEAGNVVQACAFHVENIYNPELPVSATGLEGRFGSRFALEDRGAIQANTLPSGVWVSAPLPSLRQSAAFLGHINVHPRGDGTLRHFPPALRYKDAIYPSLSLAAAAHFLGVRTRDIQVAPREVLIAGRRLPLDEFGETGINWTGGASTFPTYPLTQILDGDVPDEIIKGKIVLIGAASSGSYEYRATPFSPAQPAMEVQANALDNILLNRPLHFSPKWLRFALLLLFSVMTGALLAPRLDLGGISLLLILVGALWFLALWLLAQYNFYLPVAPAMLSAALTFALTMAINYRQEWETNFRADTSAAALARGGALMESVRDRTRLGTVIRGTARDALRAQEVLLVRGDEDDELLQTLCRLLANHRRAAFLPFPRRPSASEEAFVPDNSLREVLRLLAARYGALKDTALRGSMPPIIVAPLLTSTDQMPGRDAPKMTSGGALLAVGSREGRVFGVRDAVLLETLAEQASLALRNLEYYELLQGRVELANRDLREAYGVLAEQSAKFMAAVESIDDALVLCDAHGNAVFVNGGAAPTLREATPEIGDDVGAILKSYEINDIAALFEGLAASQNCEPRAPLRTETMIGIERDGAHPRILSAQLTPLCSDSGQLIGAMLLVADVTAQRELDQMKTDFVSFVAHELRSPLGAILGYASLMQQYAERADAAMRGEMTGAIVRQCHRLNRLIGDLLDISRLEAGHALDLRREKVELRTLAEKVLDAQRAAQQNPKVTWKLECEAAEVMAWCDPDRMEQILINLISNAAKYSPDGGEVTVKIEEALDGVVLRITDQGMGMTSEQVENLFQKYYRTPDARQRGIKGTGLGLFLVKNLVEAHGGTIRAQSEVGKGTTFTIRLPQRIGESGSTPFTAGSELETPLQVR